VSFYEPDERFLFPLDYIERVGPDETLLTVNYFGFVNDNPIIDQIKQYRPDIVTISDHSQSFWTYKQSHADYSFTSLRKQLPVPDGAYVHSKQQLVDDKFSIPVNSFYHLKLLGSILKWQKQADKLYLDLFCEGERVLDKENNIKQASLVTRFLLETMNLSTMKELRKKNTKIIYELGRAAGLNFVFDYSEDVTLLTVPILLKKRDQVRSEMMKKSIYLPIHWPISKYNTASLLAKQMASNSLSLIVDQRYSSDEISYQVNVLSNLTR